MSKLLAICTTGAHGTGKTFIIDEIEKRAIDAGIDTQKVISPTRYVKSLGFSNNKELDYRTETMCLSLRIQRQKEAFNALLESTSDKKLILADRCGLDELSYTREAFERDDLDVSSFISSTNFNRAFKLKQVYGLFYDFIFADLFEFWDRVYYKPPHPDFMPVADGDRLADRQYQIDVDSHIKFHFEDLKLKENFTDNIAQELDVDRDVAVEEVWGHIQNEFGLV